MSIFRIILTAGALLVLSGCVRLTVAWADLKPDGAAAAPPVLAAFDGAPPVTTIDEWRELRAPALRKALEREVYGVMPDASETIVLERRVLDEAAFGGVGHLEEIRFEASASFQGVTKTTQSADDARPGFFMELLLPASATGPSPIILMQTFCPRSATIPHPDVTRFEDTGGCGNGGLVGGVATYVFGRYIATPPLQEILRAGYAIAAIYPSEFVPDSEEAGLAALAELSAGHADDDTRWGAIAAWAWGYSRMVDVLGEDERVDQSAIITYGHSRYGKSALLAAAFDARIDAVISHQSGTGGASLNRRKVGESIEAITNSYPHWFSRNYAKFSGRDGEMSVDQHHLLALIAPRPVFLGNARRDVWSDPNGAFRAAMGADPVYELFGARGLDQATLKEFLPAAELSFWIRPGTHGVVEEDWPAFLDFLNAHFARGES